MGDAPFTCVCVRCGRTFVPTAAQGMACTCGQPRPPVLPAPAKPKVTPLDPQTRRWLGVALLLLVVVIGCGGKPGPLPEQPTELWPAGLYRVETAVGALHVAVAGESVAFHDWRTISAWEYRPGGWVLSGQTWSPYGRVDFRLAESLTVLLTLGDRTLRGRAALVVAHG